MERFGEEIFVHVHLTIGQRGEAEDLVQEVFLRALAGWPRFEHRADPRTWLWAITRNVLREYYRSHRTTEPLSEDIAREEGPAEAVDARIDLIRALRMLPQAQREVVILRLVQDWSVTDTARALGWPEVRVRVTLHRALQRLRTVLTPGREPVSARAEKEGVHDGSDR